MRGGLPVRIRKNEEGELVIQDMTVDIVQYELTNAADFVDSLDKKEPKSVFPPKDVCRYVLSALHWTFPPLTSITGIPVFRPNGTIVTERGYDRDTMLIYDPPEGFEIQVPERPKKTDVKKALKILGEVLNDFPYVDEASLANTLGLALTPVMREVIEVPHPSVLPR